MSDFDELTAPEYPLEEIADIPTTEFSKVSTLANQQLELERKKEDLEKELKEITAELRLVSETLLPEAMLEAGFLELGLADGCFITITEFINAHISAEKAPEAIAWLTSNGHGEIIKTQVTTKFGRSEHNEAGQLISDLRSRGLQPEVKEAVHPSTLKKFIRTELEAGRDVPDDLFGTFRGSRTKITRKS